MQRIIEQHSMSLIVGIVLLFAGGYLDVRNLTSQTLANVRNLDDKIMTVDKKVDTVTTIAVTTRTEQLLRTDEIEYVQELRRKAEHAKRMKNENPD